ncbi:protein of unknown function [Serratia sp. Tan611]|nr:protein of unknown function [Serratia sp. Tan611]
MMRRLPSHAEDIKFNKPAVVRVFYLLLMRGLLRKTLGWAVSIQTIITNSVVTDARKKGNNYV